MSVVYSCSLVQCFDTVGWMTGRHLVSQNAVPVVFRSSLSVQVE